MLWLAMLAAAQEADYPTLAALADLDAPPFRYADMIDRMSWMNPNHVPPTQPPHHEIGDREWFRLSYGADRDLKRMEMELRALTDRILLWVHVGVDYPNWRANQLAKDIERLVLDPIQKLFQFSEPPGVDGDPRLYIAMISDPDGDVLGYFPQASTRPQRLYFKSNEREMLVVNVARDDDFTFYDEILVEIIAHEYQHILHHHSDYGEELWLDEALASYAGYHAARSLFEIQGAHGIADDFLQAPHTGLTQWQADDQKGPKYGAGVLFMIYLVERFGEDIVARLLAEQANGWRAVDKVLREDHAVAAVDAFADWVLANYYLAFRRGYGYRHLEAALTPPEPSASYNSFPARHDGELAQYSTEYIAVDARGADTLQLSLWQAPAARLMPEGPAEGDRVYYALASDYSNSSLTRAFDLGDVTQAWLGFKVWHDLDKDAEYGYVTVSANDGRTWETLSGSYTRSSRVYDDYFDEGYTSRSGNWRNERIDLSPYAVGRILLRFELMSGVATSYGGMAIDDLHIKAINFHDGFESPDEAWIAEGWIRTDNRLPNNTWLQAVQDSREGLHIERALISGSGDLNVEILPGVNQVLVAVSPIVPRTSLPTEYELELNLLDAGGEIMVVTRECTLTTTHALNFRAAPNGTKIGLLARGAAVDALDRDGDWFMVVHAGRQGWIHGDYVHAAGACP